MELVKGLKVVSHKGDCIGYITEEQKMFGEIVKVNKKSFVVKFSESKSYSNGKLKREHKLSIELTYKFWKQVGEKSYYIPVISGGKKIYGAIEL